MNVCRPINTDEYRHELSLHVIFGTFVIQSANLDTLSSSLPFVICMKINFHVWNFKIRFKVMAKFFDSFCLF